MNEFAHSPRDPLHYSLSQFLTFLFTVLEAYVLISLEIDLKCLETLQFSQEPSLIQPLLQLLLPQSVFNKDKVNFRLSEL